MTNISLLAPLARFISDIGKIMIKDDQLDLAFPTRAHSGFSHHWKWGVLLHTSGNAFAELAEILRVVQSEEYKVTDTPQSFLKRVFQIHQNTYNPRQEEEEARLEMLLQYFNNLKGVNSKEKFQENYEKFMHRTIPKDVIYGGKINLSSHEKEQQQNRYQQPQQQQQLKRKSLDPPRVHPPSTSTNIRLYRPST